MTSALRVPKNGLSQHSSQGKCGSERRLNPRSPYLSAAFSSFEVMHGLSMPTPSSVVSGKPETARSGRMKFMTKDVQ